MDVMPWDDVVVSEDCACAFSPMPGMEKSVWYLRRCGACGHTWYSHHCPHDDYQARCSQCGQRAPQWGVSLAGR